MKEIVQYQCEICNRKYNSRRSAVDCEAKGPSLEYPIGMIYSYGQSKEDVKLIFAVAINRIDGHVNHGASWACRDTNAGDNFGNGLCSGNSLSLGEHDKVTAKNCKQPCFKRLVNWLKSENIPVTIWNGKEAISYE